MINNQIDESVFSKWAEAYLTGAYEDPHGSFSESLGTNRNDAKVICYKLMYDSPFIRNFHNCLIEDTKAGDAQPWPFIKGEPQ